MNVQASSIEIYVSSYIFTPNFACATFAYDFVGYGSFHARLNIRAENLVTHNNPSNATRG